MRIQHARQKGTHPFNLDGIALDALVLDEEATAAGEPVCYGTPGQTQLVVTGETFHLFSEDVSYIFRVDKDKDLVLDHFGARTDAARPSQPEGYSWAKDQRRREFPTAGRGDLRVPAVHIAHAAGHTVSQFKTFGYFTYAGKRPNGGLPKTLDAGSEAYTLGVFLADEVNQVFAQAFYSIFSCGAVARSFTIVNQGDEDIVLERAGTALELPSAELDMVHLYGSWAREMQVARRRVEHGTQG